MDVFPDIQGIRLTCLFLHVVSPNNMSTGINSANIQSSCSGKKRDSADSIGGQFVFYFLHIKQDLPSRQTGDQTFCGHKEVP